MKRVTSLDRLRGFAVALMALDHVLALFVPAAAPLRDTLTRLSMPLFCLVAGTLLSDRPRWKRWTQVALVGLVVPLYAPWIDNPNICLLLAGSLALTWALHALDLRLVVLLPIVALTGYANNWAIPPGSQFYHPVAVAALVAVGSMIPPSIFDEVGNKIPAWTEPLGRNALAFYAIHAGVLTILRLLVA